MRNLIIYASESQLKEIKKIINKYKEEFSIRNVKITYKSSNGFQAELYGYDKGLKETIYKPSEIPLLLEAIDKMPMGFQEKIIRENFADISSEDAFYYRYG